MSNHTKGFTLIELLVVIGILAILIPVVFVALNPVKRFQDAQNARRISDANSILTAVHEYIVDNKGALPTGLTAGMVEKQMGTAVSGCTVATAGCSVASTGDCVDLSTVLNKYLKSIPMDPNGGTAALTNYTISADTNNLVTVKACGAQGGSTISISR
jgi:prepilin-type N-terminal cleavage/methylation domain-containing protein